MDEMSVAERLDAIEQSDLMIAFDSCHKLYLVEGPGEIADAQQTGYDLYPAEQVRELVNKSCGLVFINGWNTYGDHPWSIEQGGMPESWYGEEGENV